MWQWLRVAFFIEPSGPALPTDAERDVIDRVCGVVVRRGLVTPALVFLESVRPLNYVSAQTLHFFAPFISALGDTQSFNEFAHFLERRGAIDYLCQRLEELVRERNSQQ